MLTDIQADDVAKALGPANMKALESLERDPAALRTLGLPPAGVPPGLGETVAGGLAPHDMGAEDSSDEGLDSEDLDYTLDEPCTNCTGNMYDGVCQVRPHVPCSHVKHGNSGSSGQLSDTFTGSISLAGFLSVQAWENKGWEYLTDMLMPSACRTAAMMR